MTTKQERLDKAYGKVFKPLVTAGLQELGAKPVEDGWYDLYVVTAAGKLRFTLYDTWVAGRFDDVEAAKQLTGWMPQRCNAFPLNPYSGKFNHHYFDGDPTAAAESFLGAIRSVLARQMPA